MRLIIAGSRTCAPTPEEIDKAISDLCAQVWGDATEVTEVVCGMAAGADMAGWNWAKAKGIPIASFPVTEDDIKRHGSYLGPRMRNRRMAEHAEAAVVFWDGLSGGSSDMVCRMVARNKPVLVVPSRQRRKPSKTRARRGAGDKSPPAPSQP